MTSFEYWSRMAPEGQFMCQVCYCSRPVAEAWRDENQLQWDVCEACKLHEGMTVVQLRHKEEIAELLDEVRALEAALELERSRYTLGGVPPGYRPWGNVKLPPPPSAESGRFDGS